MSKSDNRKMAGSDVNQRLVRYAELLPGKSAFIDARTPGSHLKENYCIIGEGVAENPDQPVHILDDKGFDFGAAGQPVGIKNSLHSHTSAECFLIFRGQFHLYWGNEGQFETILYPGDMITIPTNCFRGFDVVGTEYGFLFAVLGLDRTKAGVTWHPEVIEEAKSYGLVLLDSGSLIDTVNGQVVPEGSHPMPPLSKDQLADFRNIPVDVMSAFIVRNDSYQLATHPFFGPAVKQYNLSGSELSELDFQVRSTDGFCIFCYELGLGVELPLHKRTEKEVLLNFSGDTLLTLDDGKSEQHILLTKGDTFNLPTAIPYKLECQRGTSIIYSIVAGDTPAIPLLITA